MLFVMPFNLKNGSLISWMSHRSVFSGRLKKVEGMGWKNSTQFVYFFFTIKYYCVGF